MKIIKLLLSIIATASIFSIGCLFCLIRPFHRNNAYLISRFFAKAILKIWNIDIVVEGNIEILQDPRPVVFVANHQHNFDLILAAYMLKPNTVSVGKASLGKIPIFGQFYRLSGNILVDRSNPKKAIKALKEVAKKIVEKRISIWIFPEGKRNTERPMIPFKRGAFISATESHAPIVPIVIEPYLSKPGFRNFLPFQLKIKILPLVDTATLTDSEQKDLHQKIYLTMENALNSF